MWFLGYGETERDIEGEEEMVGYVELISCAVGGETRTKPGQQICSSVHVCRIAAMMVGGVQAVG